MPFLLRPISDWSAMGIGDYKHSPFTVTYSQALEVLERELDHLDVTHATVELAISPEQLKLNGELRANQRPTSPAVRLLFSSPVHGDLVYETDEFIKPTWRHKGMQADWQHNLYAIAKGLEGLRMLDRYGITRGTRQYTGFKAIGGSGSAVATEPPLDREAACKIISRFSGVSWETIGSDAAVQVSAVRRAKAATHPDAGGNRADWDAVDRAARRLA